MAAAIRAGFLETAQGPWLTLLAQHVFNVARREATFATGELLFTNTGGGIYAFNADEVRALWADEGKAYTNAEPFTLNPAESKLVAIRAVEVGAASSAPPGAITSLETFILGVAVTNPEAVVGSDAETDDELRTACRNKLAALSVRGPRDAYAFAVREARRPDGSAVDINRQQVSPSSSTGVVTVYLASPSGAPSSTDIEYVAASIEAIARPDSVTVVVLPAVEVPLTRTLTVWAKRTSGVSANDIRAAVESALVSEIRAYPIGGIPKPPSTQGYLYGDFISGVVKSAHVSIYDVDGVGGDVALGPGEVATLATTITVRIVEVS
ncbi:MAG: baseplate J/gp47 family protein [Labilithrix sp.]|nr:baseplate J/gp47 family protein [Labilithrix sp.]